MYAFNSNVFLLVFALYSSLVLSAPIRRRSCKGLPSGASGLGEAANPLPSLIQPPEYSSSPSSSYPPRSSISSSSSASVPSPSSSNSTGAVGSLIKALFPISQSNAWSTSSESDHALPLSDATLRPMDELKSLSHEYINAPDGKLAMKAHYPKGSYNFQHFPQGGFSFYAPGPQDVDLTTAKEATFGYSVFFEEGFDWVEGGKLPGLYGGDDGQTALSCSGGRRSDTCFSARLMWRVNGAGELYSYLPPFTDPRFAANKKQCNVAPLSDCNPTYGASIGRGAFHFKAGAWTTVSQRVRLNDVGHANGELELFVNGESVINVDGLILRARDAGRIRGVQAQTFFGGSHPDFASREDTNAYFSDFSVAITQTL